MSKWNKQNSQPLSQEFVENEERRKQMIIEAAKRRKEKEKKQLEQEQLRRKDEELALTKHKQEKKDAYVKYLRNNIYDKYEEAKRKKKEATNEIKPMAKWKKKSAEKEEGNAEDEDNQLQALDLQVNLEKGLLSDFDQKPPKNESNQQSNTRKKLNEEFEKEWQFEIDAKEDLLSSKLLDSLDLDAGTLNRDYQMKEMIKQKNKITHLQMPQKNEEIMQLRDLIGYESIVITQNVNSKIQSKVPKVETAVVEKVGKNMAKKAEVDEVEVLNELKHKKEAKVLNWAIQEEQQAEDLFSECSSINRKKQPKALKELNEQLKNKKTAVVTTNKMALQTIKQVRRQKIASRERKTTSNDAPKVSASNEPPKQTEKAVAKNQRPLQSSKQKQEKPQRINSKSMEKRANATSTSNPTFSKKQPKKEAAKTTTGFGSEKNITRVRATSKQKKDEQKPANIKQQPPKPNKPQPAKKLFGNLPPLPVVARTDNNSIATHDMQIDVESFIKQDLINLNERERELQEELRQLHKERREDLHEVYSKYGIRTDYHHSNQITGQAPRQNENKYYQSEEDIEDSLQNLENYQIRRNIESKDQNRTIREATEENNSESLINPFSSSEVLCNQVLKLAKNIERFERKPAVEDPNGYGYMNKMKRNNSANKISEVSRITKDSKKDKQRERREEELAESQQVSEMREDPISRPPFIFDASEVSCRLRREEKEEKAERIHVNPHLLKGLLDDD